MATSTTSTTGPWTNLAGKRVLITGATSGLGFEAAAQLADKGVGSITITGRTADKANAAAAALRERTGRDVFDTLVVDVADLASSRQAAEQLASAGTRYDAVILNAGMVPAELHHTADGFEECFASSLLGHHVITESLIATSRLQPNARVLMVGSEAGNNDIPKMMGMKVPGFITDPSSDDAAFRQSLDAFAHGPQKFNPKHQYAGTKAISALWSGAMARRHSGASFVTVSPGSAMSTDAARHMTGMFKVMIKMMRKIGPKIGMDQTTADAAKRYVDVVLGNFPTQSGGLYTSAPKKMVGKLNERHVNFLEAHRTEDLAVSYLDQVTANASA